MVDSLRRNDFIYGVAVTPSRRLCSTVLSFQSMVRRPGLRVVKQRLLRRLYRIA
jgi:hypothetical protein